MNYSGGFTPAIADAARRLYFRRPLVNRAWFVLGALLMIFLTQIGESPLLVDLLLALFTVIFLVLAFAIERLWWIQWWPRYAHQFGLEVSGVAGRNGVKLTPTAKIIPWDGFKSAKLEEEMVLLYISRTMAFPISRQFFKTDTEWNEFRSLVRSKVAKSSAFA